jgi:solute carrier family 8 (sodium/calcium exchanger)
MKLEAGSSPAMEYMAFTRLMESVAKSNLNVSTFVSDRHSSIAKHMREKLPDVKHYFDLWHLTKSMYYPVFCIVILSHLLWLPVQFHF